MLTDHKNDLFVTHDTMPAALRAVNDLCAAAASSADSIAIRTAAQIILNTAIELHRAEKQVLIDKINEMSARANPVTALLSLVREQVAQALNEQTIDEKIENWMADNLQDHVEECIDMDEKIAEQVSSFFGHNTFSIEPR
jgi:hypothetical protein